MRVVRYAGGSRISKDVYKRQKNYLDPKIYDDMEWPYSQKKVEIVISRKNLENRPPTDAEKMKRRRP